MQWLMLVVTFAVMAVLHRVARSAPVEAQATLALGALLLLAYIAGNIARRFRLPRVAGYLVAGLLAGPSWWELVSQPALDKLSPFSSGALFLIACAVGNALSLELLRGERRARVLRIAGTAMAVPFLAVVFVVLTVSPWFPLTAHQPFRDALVVALALGTVAAVSSPAHIWAVVSDSGARGGGPLSETTLDVSVLQDFAAALLVVLMLALALPIGSRGTVLPGSALQTLIVIGGSIVAGVTLALAASQYLKVIQKRLAWVLVILALIAAQGVRLLGLDAVLMGVAAGLALRVIAPEHGARVKAELERCAIPVYVVFFALAGANLQLAALDEMWPWALLLVGLRITGLWGGMRWAVRRGAISPDWATRGWLGLVSQGGFALTLAAVFRRAFPEWNVSMEALVVAMIGMQQLAGPISFHWVLRRTGEVLEEVHDRPTLGSPETVAPSSAVLVPTGGSGVS